MSRRLAVFIPNLDGGGAERVSVMLANGFADRGLLVDLVAGSASGPYAKEVSPSVKIVDLGKKRVSKAIPALVKYLRAREPEAVITGLDHANLATVLAVKVARVQTKVVATVHSSVSRGLPRSPVEHVLNALMRLAYPRVHAIVAVSEAIRSELVQEHGVPSGKVFAILNPLDLAMIDRQRQRGATHPWLVDARVPTFVALGRLTPAKNYASLLRAFHRVESVSPARLIIFGEGESRQELVDLARKMGLNEVVSMPGFVANPYAELTSASAFVLSSAWEGLPGALMEAMACDRPVIATDCPTGPAEILENGRWGFLVPANDDGALADAMLRLIHNGPVTPSTRPRAEDFRLDRAVTSYLALI